MAESKNLKTAVDTEVKEAVKTASTGNVSTAKSPPQTDLPTNTRRHLPPS